MSSVGKELRGSDLPGMSLCFDEMTRGDGGVSVRGITPLRTTVATLIAAEVVVVPAEQSEEVMEEAEEEGDDEGQVRMEGVLLDGWCKMRMQPGVAEMVSLLQTRLHEAFLMKMASPMQPLEPREAAVVATICAVIRHECATLPRQAMEALSYKYRGVASAGRGSELAGVPVESLHMEQLWSRPGAEGKRQRGRGAPLSAEAFEQELDNILAAMEGEEGEAVEYQGIGGFEGAGYWEADEAAGKDLTVAPELDFIEDPAMCEYAAEEGDEAALGFGGMVPDDHEYAAEEGDEIALGFGGMVPDDHEYAAEEGEQETAGNQACSSAAAVQLPIPVPRAAPEATSKGCQDPLDSAFEAQCNDQVAAVAPPVAEPSKKKKKTRSRKKKDKPGVDPEQSCAAASSAAPLTAPIAPAVIPPPRAAPTVIPAPRGPGGPTSPSQVHSADDALALLRRLHGAKDTAPAPACQASSTFCPPLPLQRSASAVSDSDEEDAIMFVP